MPPSISPQGRLKVSLKMAISRLRFTQTKKTALAKQQRRQMAELLALGKEESARIRVEIIVREDIYIELLEILELYCELLLARIGLLDKKECDPGLEEAAKTIIYAAPHTDVKELSTIRDLLAHKFGAEFTHAALDNDDGIIPDKVVKLTVVKAPSEELVTLYLSEIARAYDVPFSGLTEEGPDGKDANEEEEEEDDDDEGVGGKPITVEAIEEETLEERLTTPRKMSAGQLPHPPEKPSPISVRPPGKTVDNPHPVVKIPQDLASQVTKKKRNSDVGIKKREETDLDALRKRFEALKR